MKHYHYSFTSIQVFLSMIGAIRQHGASAAGYLSTKHNNFPLSVIPRDPKIIHINPYEKNHEQQRQKNIEFSSQMDKDSKNINDHTTFTARSSVYDLGLGKNHPVIARSKKEFHMPKATTENRQQHQQKENYDATSVTHDAVRYWIGHESVNKYPSPLDNNEKLPALPDNINNDNGNEITLVKNANQRGNTMKRNKRKHLIQPRPKRMLEDVLLILDTSMTEDEQNPSSLPTMVTRPTAQHTPQLDVNSVWVEMLIHKEQQQLVYS